MTSPRRAADPPPPDAQPPRDGVWSVTAELAGRPLDGALRSLTAVSWAEARRLIETGKVLLGGTTAASARRRVLAGERIEVRLHAPRPETVRLKRLEEDLIVHVDASVVVVHKPAGVITVPFGDEAPAAQGDALDALVREVLARRDRIRGRAPLGVVQRLDKGTSGLLVFARTLAAKKHLSQQLRFHTMHRRYLAIAHGVVPARAHRSYLIEDRGDGLRGSATARQREGQLAVTHVAPVEALRGATLVSCRLETGRTHQIRIHLAEAGHPIVGEAVYVRSYEGPRIPAPRPMLHAAELGFRHPADNREVRFEAPPPEDFEEILARLRT